MEAVTYSCMLCSSVAVQFWVRCFYLCYTSDEGSWHTRFDAYRVVISVTVCAWSSLFNASACMEPPTTYIKHFNCPTHYFYFQLLHIASFLCSYMFRPCIVVKTEAMYRISVNGKYIYLSICCIPRTMVGWERRMWKRRPRGKSLNALEHLRVEIQVPSNSRWCVNIFLIY